ncbi:MAG: hypothetical protein JWN50_395 [Parcubacteria group bacterium]|nr:hypothetical protein [Parcubacteria group bacterium]
MKKNDINKSLEEIIRIAQAILDNGLTETGKSAAVARVPRGTRSVAGTQSLPDRILTLRDSGFFKQARLPSEVHAKLQSTYECELSRVETALYRLKGRKQLRVKMRKVGNSQQNAFVW